MYEKLCRFVLRYGFDKESYDMCAEELQKAQIALARIFAHLFILINIAIIILNPDKVNNPVHLIFIFITVATLFLIGRWCRFQYKYMMYIIYAELIVLLRLTLMGKALAYTYDDIVLIVITIMCLPILTLGKPIVLLIMVSICSVGFGYLRADLGTSVSFGSYVIDTTIFCLLCICMHYIVGRMWYKGSIIKKQLVIAERKMELALENSEIYTWEYDIDKRKSIQSESESHAMDVPKEIDNFPESAISSNYIAPESFDEYRRIHNEVENGRKEASAEIGYVFPNGDIRWRRVKYLTIFDSNGTPIKAIGCSSDITMEIALRNAKATVERHLAFAIENGDQAEGSLIASAFFNVSKGFIIKQDFKKFNEELCFDGMSLNNALKIIANTVLEEPDRKKWLDIYNSDNLIREYSRGAERLVLDTKRIMQNGKQIMARDVIRLKSDQLTGDIFAIAQLYDIDEIKIREQILNSIIDDNYDFIAKISTEDGSYTVYSSSKKKQNILPKSGDSFEKAVKEFFNNLKDKSGVINVVPNMNLDYMKKYLESNERFELMVKTNLENEGTRYKKISYHYLDSQHKSILFTREDVTQFIIQEHRKNEALSLALDTAEKANAAKSDFLSKMSHDIRTPMNIILNMSALALDELDNPAATKEYLEKITTTGGFLLSLINDVLDVSKIESGTLELKKEVYNCEAFNSFIVSMIEPLCSKYGVEFVVRLERMDVCVYTDITRFNQIFLNLLSNAVKFTPEGGRIEFLGRIAEEDEQYLVKEYIVRDNGIGISEEFMEKMFSPFAQESSEVTSELEGTGLGLSIVKSIVDAMGGTISVKSKKGEGTEFIVRIKMEIAKAEEKIQTLKLQPKLECDCLKGLNILLVEDHPLNAEIAEKILSRNGANVFSAENGLIALNEFTNSDTGYFDVILMDIRMPVMDGIEATKRIRALERPDALSVPIIAMSANAFDDDKIICIKEGINEYLTKPIETKKLLETILNFAKKNETK